MNQEITTLRKNLKLALLAGTCLGAGASLGNAATVIESGDFSNTLIDALSSSLPFGTDQVQGSVVATDTVDFVAFTSLLANTPFTMSFTLSNVFDIANFDVIDSSGVHVGSPSAVPGQNSGIFSGTIPSDGKLVAQVAQNETGSSYTINLTAATVPEPNSAVLAALGVSAAALRRSRRTKQAP